jgi:putative transposon-encoded protein
MARIIELKKEELILKESEIEGFLERVVSPFGTSAKADVPRKYIGRRVYVIITKSMVEGGIQ